MEFDGEDSVVIVLTHIATTVEEYEALYSSKEPQIIQNNANSGKYYCWTQTLGLSYRKLQSIAPPLIEPIRRIRIWTPSKRSCFERRITKAWLDGYDVSNNRIIVELETRCMDA